jgi:hypothetical protein
LPPDTYIYLWSETQPIDFLFKRNDYSWACHDLFGEPLTSLTEGLPVRGASSTDVAYVVLNPLARVEEISGLIQHFYPEASCRSLAGEQGLYTIVSCQISGQVINQRRGLQGEYYQRSDFVGSPALRRIDEVASVDWERESTPLDVPFGVIWRGILYVEQGGHYGLGSDTDDKVEMTVDGQCLFSTLEGKDSVRAADLTKGWHAIGTKLIKRVPGGRFNLYVLDEEGHKRGLPDENLLTLDSKGLAGT